MTNSLAYERNFARVTSVTHDWVHLTFDTEDAWPWLSLPARHPVLLEKYQYFGVLSAVWAAKLMDPTHLAALTEFRWRARASASAPSFGRCQVPRADRGERYRLELYGEPGDPGLPQAALWGTGVNLGAGDVRALRAASRAKALRRAANLPRPELEGARFVTPPRAEGGRLHARGLVTSQEGFHPAHPFHTGSGDHVNAAQLFDCALQLASFVFEEEGLGERCASGAARFSRFVELDVPFETQTWIRERTVETSFTQLGRANCRIEMSFDARR